MRGLARALVCMPLLIAILPSSAAAQQPSGIERLVAGGFGGVTATSGATDLTAAGQAGVRLSRHVVVFGEGGHMRNVIPSSREAGMEQVVAGVYLRNPAAPVTVDAVYSTNYGLGGARWLVRSFYVEAGVGAANVHTRLDQVVSNGTDITSAYAAGLRSGTDLGTQTVPMVTVGGGISAHVSKMLAVDLGYRYTWINTFAPAVKTNVVYAGVGIGR